MSPPRLDQPFVTGALQTSIGVVPQVSSTLGWRDHWGSIRARWGVGRMDYTLDPGLYALGTPNNDSPVLATANYKMSFDRLREALPGRSAWILVLDTRGINVWCAAGKGTFGTEELGRRIASSRLGQLIRHRRIILPQLGAPGIAAHQLRRLSGFKAVYGPIRAEDLPAFLDSGMKATPEMRRKTFTLRERLVLIPVEVVAALKPALAASLVFFLLAGFGGPGSYGENALAFGSHAVAALMAAVFAGCVLTPLLLPWLPGRAFATKGLVVGAAVAAVSVGLRALLSAVPLHPVEAVAWLLITMAVTAYLAMNFTGASTYTSLSGVRREMRWALPLEITAGAAGAVLWLVSRFLT